MSVKVRTPDFGQMRLASPVLKKLNRIDKNDHVITLELCQSHMIFFDKLLNLGQEQWESGIQARCWNCSH